MQQLQPSKRFMMPWFKKACDDVGLPMLRNLFTVVNKQQNNQDSSIII
jgi:hypothetical protein